MFGLSAPSLFGLSSTPLEPLLTMPGIKDLKLPEGEKDAVIVANREVLKLQNKITFNIKDGNQFPALLEIQRLQNLDDPTGSGIYKDLARSQARVNLDEVTRLISEMEASCSNLAAEVVSLGEGLNSTEDLDTAVAEIKSTEALYVGSARVALVHLAEATGGSPPPAVFAPPPPAIPRPEVDRFTKISATAEPSNLPRDVSPTDFLLWLMKFNTFSNASWIPEKLRQLRVHLGTAWQDVLETVELEHATYEEIIKLLSDEISITFPVVSRRIELFSNHNDSDGKSKDIGHAVTTNADDIEAQSKNIGNPNDEVQSTVSQIAVFHSQLSAIIKFLFTSFDEQLLLMVYKLVQLLSIIINLGFGSFKTNINSIFRIHNILPLQFRINCETKVDIDRINLQLTNRNNLTEEINGVLARHDANIKFIFTSLHEQLSPMVTDWGQLLSRINNLGWDPAAQFGSFETGIDGKCSTHNNLPINFKINDDTSVDLGRINLELHN